MNLSDAGVLVAEARALYPAMTIVPGIADAWLGVLGDLRMPECQDALMQHARTEARIPAPADIRRRVLATRQDAAMRDIPTYDPDALNPMPDWFHDHVAKSKANTRAANRERADRGEKPQYGQTVMRPSDGRLR